MQNAVTLGSAPYNRLAGTDPTRQLLLWSSRVVVWVNEGVDSKSDILGEQTCREVRYELTPATSPITL